MYRCSLSFSGSVPFPLLLPSLPVPHQIHGNTPASMVFGEKKRICRSLCRLSSSDTFCLSFTSNFAPSLCHAHSLSHVSRAYFERKKTAVSPYHSLCLKHSSLSAVTMAKALKEESEFQTPSHTHTTVCLSVYMIEKQQMCAFFSFASPLLSSAKYRCCRIHTMMYKERT